MPDELTSDELHAIWAVLHVRGIAHLAARVAAVRDSRPQPDHEYQSTDSEPAERHHR